MKVYANPGSGSACVEATLAELELPFERVLVDYTEDGIVDPEFIKINPRRQIPVLVLDNGECLTETMAILMYLAEKTGRLLPGDTRTNALTRFLAIKADFIFWTPYTAERINRSRIPSRSTFEIYSENETFLEEEVYVVCQK